MIKKRTVPMQFHPRAFEAFGGDLVTNDYVAVNELVKNSYDAFAFNVLVSIKNDEQGKQYIEIKDDGLGMTQEIIEKAWAVIATPYKKTKPYAERNGLVRVVSGNKGLGRLSASRLGKKMEILSKHENDDCLFVSIDWTLLASSTDISLCGIDIDNGDYSFLQKSICDELQSVSSTGTIIRILELNSEWNEKKFEELKNSLARLISPFDGVSDFKITVNNTNSIAEIHAHEFINNPTYLIYGNVDEHGLIKWNYKCNAVYTDTPTASAEIPWSEAYGGFRRNSIVMQLEENNIPEYSCGGFDFEFRAWDLDTDSIDSIKENFNIKKGEIRKTIALYKGISIYRDNVLVLPKSDAAKDWLGVDLRRVSNIGRRLSTNQIIGKISITEKGNPQLKDTTDREKLVDTEEYRQFCYILESIIIQLELLRNKNRSMIDKKPGRLVDLIKPIDPAGLVANVESLINENKGTEEILDVVRDYGANTEKSIGELEERMEYYAQTASLGSVAFVIMHEIRTGMTIIKRFVRRFKRANYNEDSILTEYSEDAEIAHSRLLEVANSFAPLYRRGISKEKNIVKLDIAVNNSIRLIKAKKEAKDVAIKYCGYPEYDVAMHSGELQTVFLNLLDNSCYWLSKTGRTKEVSITASVVKGRVRVNISDNGPGINPEDGEKIFLPGNTSKLHGIGMGLVIVTELLNNHNCSIETVIPGDIGGATFVFDLPLIK